MEIYFASVMGFCFGVERAVEIAEKTLTEYKNIKVYSLGPLIHNEEFLSELSSKGLLICDENNIEAIEEGSAVIIRAHGVTPAIISKLEEKKCIIVDATCPRVKASQTMVSKYTGEGKHVILSGDKNHGEVKSIAGFAKKSLLQLQTTQEAENITLDADNSDEYVLMSQTTFSPDEFEKIQTILQNKINKLTVKNTICPATKERQDSLLELCNRVEGVLVIGGKNSANTKRLFQTAKENCKFAAHIQTADDIPEDFYKLNTVGITAGASTPAKIIEEVKNKLSKKVANTIKNV